MKKLIWFASLLVGALSWAQPGGGASPPPGLANQCPSNVVESANCSGYERQWCIDYVNSVIFACNPTTHIWNSVGSAGGGGGGGAPVGATYITRTANSTLTGEFALTTLNTGILKWNDATELPVIAVAADFPPLNQSTTGNAATATALSSDPAACATNKFVNDMSATGALGCQQPAFTDLLGQISEAQLPTEIATDNEVSAGYQPLDSGVTGDLTQIAALNDCTVSGSPVDGKILKVAGGVWTCQDDQTTTGGTGITTLNGLTDGTQSLVAVDSDANLHSTITETGSTHNFTPVWNGTLALSRLAPGTGLSVLGVTGSGSTSNASIVALQDGQVLRRLGTAVGFGAVALDDPDAISGSLPATSVAAGLTDTQVNNDLTITAGTINLTQSTAPIPTAEGRIEWETDDDHIIVGDSAAQVEFVPAEDVSGDITMLDTGATTIGNDKVTGAMIDLGTDAVGDMMYNNGTDWVRLAATSNTNILTLVGGLPAWVPPTGGGTIDGSGATSQLTGWTDSNTVQGVSGTAFTSTGDLTATSFTTPAHATDGGNMSLLEGIDDGSNSFQLKVPDSGLTASKICTLTATGLLPADCVVPVVPSALNSANGTGTTGQCVTKTATGTDTFTWGPCGTGGTSPLTTKGDIWGFSTVDARVPVGSTNGQILSVDSAQALGVKWSDGLSTTITTSGAGTTGDQGDILYRNASTWVNLPKGTPGQLLSSTATNPSWVTATGTGTVTSITASSPLSGGAITGSGSIGVTANAIGFTHLVQSTGPSVIGRSANTLGDNANISAAADGNVLRRSGTTLGFGQITLNDATNTVTGTLAGTNGGTGNAFMTFSGPASAVKTFTLPNVTSTIMTAANTGTSSANVLHGSASGVQTWGQVALATDVSGNLPVTNLGSGGGTASATTFLRGDNTWATPAGSGTVTNTGNLTANSVVLGNGTTDTKVVAGITSDGTSALVLGVAGTSVGDVDFKNATSGTISLRPVTGALGTTVLQMPAPGTTDTLATLNAAQTFTNKTLTAPVLGAATATTINGNTFTTGSYTLTGAAAKTLTFNNSITFAGTDATTMTFPNTSATVARTDAANDFTGTNVFVTNPSILLGVPGTAVGSIGFRNATSGTITLSPVTGALGTITLSLPSGGSDTLVGKATSDTLTNKILSDSTSTFGDNSDTTKKLAFELSGITTATTRTWTVPNVSDTMVGTTASQTLTTKTIDTTTASGNVITFKQVSFLPIEWCIDGGTAPTAAATLSSTNKVRIREFSGTADNDVQCPWMVPSDIVAGSNFTYRVIAFTSNATAPTTSEVVHFTLHGNSLANSEILSTSLTPSTAVASSVTTDNTYVQYDRVATAYSSAVAITGLAAGETAMLKLSRLGASTDTYNFALGVVGIEIKYTRQLNND